MKQDLKEKAISLRKKGLSYSEVLKEVSVSKSTLSLWLRSVGLSKQQEQRLTEKKLASMKRGAEAKHQQRIDLIKKIEKETKNDVEKLDRKNLWLAGIMLYWAEGTKEKSNTIGHGVTFNNSDSKMARLFIKWLREIAMVADNDLVLSIYIHRTANSQKALEYWARILNCQKNDIKVYYKRHNLQTNRKNIGENYHGLLRISVRKSSVLNRKIAAWVNHICNYWKIK